MNGAWRFLQEFYDQFRLAAMPAEIAGIEQPPPICLDQKSIGVEGGVIGELWRDAERPDLEGHPVGECPDDTGNLQRSHEGRRRCDDGPGMLSHEHRDLWVGFSQEPHVVAMAVTEDHGKRSIVFTSFETRDGGQEVGGGNFGGEREPEVNDNCPALGLELDAVSADLGGAAMNSEPHVSKGRAVRRADGVASYRLQRLASRNPQGKR